MKKPLQYFRHMTRRFILELEGMKNIMRVETRRTITWWLVLPAVGDSDSVCVLLHKVTTHAGNHFFNVMEGDSKMKREYSDRIKLQPA